MLALVDTMLQFVWSLVSACTSAVLCKLPLGLRLGRWRQAVRHVEWEWVVQRINWNDVIELMLRKRGECAYTV